MFSFIISQTIWYFYININVTFECPLNNLKQLGSINIRIMSTKILKIICLLLCLLAVNSLSKNEYQATKMTKNTIQMIHITLNIV